MKIVKLVLCSALVCMAAFALNIQVASAEELKRADSQAVIELINSGKGKVTVINFWASWCPPCREEIPELKRIREDFTEDQLLLVGVSVDEVAENAEQAVQDFSLNYPVVIAERDVYETFGIQSIPRLLVYDKNGKLIFDQVGLAAYEDLKRAINELLENK